MAGLSFGLPAYARSRGSVAGLVTMREEDGDKGRREKFKRPWIKVFMHPMSNRQPLNLFGASVKLTPSLPNRENRRS